MVPSQIFIARSAHQTFRVWIEAEASPRELLTPGLHLHVVHRGCSGKAKTRAWIGDCSSAIHGKLKVISSMQHPENHARDYS
jgi:hypothetical protein